MKTDIPERLRQYVVEKKELCLEGDVYVYFVVLSSLGMILNLPPVFTTRIGEVPVVSDAYPEIWREFAVMHDIMEREAAPSMWQHLSGTIRELELVKSRGVEMLSYVTFRIEFFTQLVHHLEDLTSTLTITPQERSRIERIRRSLNHLDRIHLDLANSSGQ